MSEPTKEQRDEIAREAVACPVCTANRGEWCRDRAGQPVDQHPERDDAAARKAAEAADNAATAEAVAADDEGAPAEGGAATDDIEVKRT